ncbi:hypothetical protein Q667_15755 [Marinobacter sp. C1S70]|nr:hypothetical protein Q667_15755 [Marinobacter sp. C1S70]
MLLLLRLLIGVVHNTKPKEHAKPRASVEIEQLAIIRQLFQRMRYPFRMAEGVFHTFQQ